MKAGITFMNFWRLLWSNHHPLLQPINSLPSFVRSFLHGKLNKMSFLMTYKIDQTVPYV